MRAFTRKTKLTVAVSATAALAATGGIAYAYWGTSGSGTGSGTVESTTGTLSLSASFPTTGLHPGGSVPVSFRASNATSTDLMLSTIHAVVTTSPSTCLATDFTMPDVIANEVIPANTANVLVTSNGVLTFTNTSISQDACKGATVTLTLTS